MLSDGEITRLRQARDATERALSEARRNLGAAQSAYSKARKAERAALLDYVEAMEATHPNGAKPGLLLSTARVPTHQPKLPITAERDAK